MSWKNEKETHNWLEELGSKSSKETSVNYLYTVFDLFK